MVFIACQACDLTQCHPTHNSLMWELLFLVSRWENWGYETGCESLSKVGKSYDPSMVTPEPPGTQLLCPLPCLPLLLLPRGSAWVFSKLCPGCLHAHFIYAENLRLCFCQIVLFSSQHVKNPSEMKSTLILHKHFQSPSFIKWCYSRKRSKNVKQILHQSTDKYQLFIHTGNETFPHWILQASTSKYTGDEWGRREWFTMQRRCFGQPESALQCV